MYTNWLGGRKLYGVGLTVQEREQQLAELRSMLPAMLRTVPIGLILVWLTWQLFLSWGYVASHFHVLWASAFLGPFFWVLYYSAVAFSNYEVVFKEHRLVKWSIQPRSFRWGAVRKAELSKFSDKPGGQILISFRLEHDEIIYLPSQSDFNLIEKILTAKLGDRLLCTNKPAPEPKPA